MATSASNPQPDLIGIDVEDTGRSLAFYREFGLDIPIDDDPQPHAEATLRGGLRPAWDTIDTVRSFDPEFQARSGSRIGLAFRLPDPAVVSAGVDA